MKEDDNRENVPLLVIADSLGLVAKIYVSKAQVVAGLNYIAEGADANDTFERLKFVLQDLIATSHK